MTFDPPNFPLARWIEADGFIYIGASIVTDEVGSFIEYLWGKKTGEQTTVRELYPF